MLTSLSMVVKRHRLVTFFSLAFGLSWLGWPLYRIGVVDGPLFPYGPFFAALIVAGIGGGRVDLKDLLGRMVRWRVGLRWYGVALLLPAAMVGTAVFLTRSLGASVDAPLGPWYGVVVVVLFQTFFPLLGAFGEELGWRGYALPRLQAGRSVLGASLVLGLIWAAWHLPLFATGVWRQPVPHVLSIVALAIVINWLFNQTNGSVLVTMVIHGAFNGVSEFLYPAIGASNLDLFWWLIAAITSVAALGVVVVARGDLAGSGSTPSNITRDRLVSI